MCTILALCLAYTYGPDSLTWVACELRLVREHMYFTLALRTTICFTLQIHHYLEFVTLLICNLLQLKPGPSLTHTTTELTWSRLRLHIKLAVTTFRKQCTTQWLGSNFFNIATNVHKIYAHWLSSIHIQNWKPPSYSLEIYILCTDNTYRFLYLIPVYCIYSCCTPQYIGYQVFHCRKQYAS